MEYKKKINIVGDKRIRTFFAWFPIWCINDNVSIMRWLEKVTVEEEYVEMFLGEYIDTYWKVIRFL